MKKIFKTLVSLCLLLSLSSTAVLAAPAEKTIKTGDVKTVEELSKKYNLEDPGVIPEGIIPLKFNSVEEADIYFSNAIKQYELQKDQKEVKKSREPKDSLVTPSVISTRSETHNVG